MTGLSCTHYGAFADLPEAQAFSEKEIKMQSPLIGAVWYSFINYPDSFMAILLLVILTNIAC